jgi:TonB-dependent SusC/RagA subfamily outer membrane receptor
VAMAAAGTALTGALALLLACGAKGPPERSPAPRSTNDNTGAVTSLPDSTLTDRHVESVEELLQGRVAGLEVIHLPNGDLSLRIRGGKFSLLENAEPGEPLVVIDGMRVAPGHLTRALRDLQPSEIARIEVLKDVSSTSMYGMAGANGVILITTKRD